MPDIDFTDLKSIATVDTYDLFSLVGMETMAPKDQASVVMDLQMLIWSAFLTQRLPLLLTQMQLEHLRNLVSLQQPMETIIAEITKFIPSLKPLWIEFSLDFKLQWVKQYWIDREAELQTSMDRTSSALKPKIEKELHRAHQAVLLANAGQWPALIKFLNPQSSSVA